MKINEEIKRIKSLFGNDRLYGNLVNEQPYAIDKSKDGEIDKDEATDFLQSQGYIVKQTTEHDQCIGVGTDLGKVRESLSSYAGIVNFNKKIQNYGDTCGLTLKNKVAGAGKFFIISLFENMDGKKQFNIFYETKNDQSDQCALSASTLGGWDIFVGSDDFNIDTSTKVATLGMKYIKIEGEWEWNGRDSKCILKDAMVVALLNKKLKTIRTSFSVSAINIDLGDPPINIDTETGGSALIMKGTSSCLTVELFSQEKLGGWNLISPIDLTNILPKLL